MFSANYSELMLFTQMMRTGNILRCLNSYLSYRISFLKLYDIIQQPGLEGKLLNEPNTLGFITSMAMAPNLLPPPEWLSYLWGGDESAPFDNATQLEQYVTLIIDLWNHTRSSLLDNRWQWPALCKLDEKEIVNDATRSFCEGILQGWQLTNDDWQTVVSENSEDEILLSGVLFSLTMLYDPETSITALTEKQTIELEQFNEIFDAIPMMLCALTQRGAMR